MATRAEVVAEARTWIGTRFHHQARVKGTGVDCINLVMAVGTDLGFGDGAKWENYPEYHGYGKSPNGPLLIEGCERFMERIAIQQALPGDVLVMRFVEEPQHFAIITEAAPMYIVHAYAQVRRVTEHRFDDVWRSRVVGAFRFKGIEP